MAQTQGLRATRIRRALLRFLSENGVPLTAAELQEQFSRQGLNPNKTTLYRALEDFVEQGRAIKVDLGDNVRRYEAADARHHHHAVCLDCGRVEDIELPENALSFSERKLKKKGFQPTSHSLEFFGLCKNCL